MEKVFLNDKLVDVDKAAVSVNDAGLLYGVGLFETMRAYNGEVFCLDDHLDRLFYSAGRLSIAVAFDKEYIRDAIYKTLRTNGLRDARMRLTLTAGSLQTGRQGQSTLFITTTSIRPYASQFYEKGVLVVLSAFRQNSADPVHGHKTINYLPRMMALDRARSQGATESLWFTTDNRLAEGCISNVFLVKDSSLYTPSLETPVLAGVARKAICRLAGTGGIKLTEKDLYLPDCLNADEVFLTNVIMQILPVAAIEKHAVGDGRPGKITSKLMRLYDEYVREQCGV